MRCSCCFYPSVLGIVFAVLAILSQGATGQSTDPIRPGDFDVFGLEGTRVTPDIPGVLEFPEGFLTSIGDALRTTSRYVSQSVPIYDRDGNLCPPLPPGETPEFTPDCVGHQTCQTVRGQCPAGGWVLTHIVCPVCPMSRTSPEKQLQICLIKAKDQLDACLYNAHVEEIICRADARERAFEFCKDEGNRLRVIPRTGGIVTTISIEACIASQLRTTFRPTGEMEIGGGIGILPTPSVGTDIGFGIRFTGPYRECQRQRLDTEKNQCDRAFRQNRDNCDKCLMTNCP